MKRSLALLLVLLTANPAFALPGRIQNEDVKSLTDIQSSVNTITGTVTSGNACITSPSSTSRLATGQFIYDTTTSSNVPSGTTIAGLPGSCSAGQIQMSANAAGNGSGDTLTFGGQMSQLINDTKIYVTANSLNQQLSTAITTGAVGGGSGAAQNILTNPGFEIGTAQTGWTADTVSKANETTNVFEKLQSVALTYSSNSGGIHQDVTPPTATAAIQTSGAALVASCRIKTTLTDIQVCARSGGVNVSCSTVSSVGNWVIQPVNFTGPANGTSIGVAVASVGSDTGTVYVDDCYVGAASTPQNFGQVSQAVVWGTANTPVTASCDWLTASTSFANFAAVSACPVATVTGNVTAPGTKIPGFVLNNVPPGNYEVTAQFMAGRSGGAAAFNAWQLTDGTQNFSNSTYFNTSTFYAPMTLTGVFSYTTAQSSVTIQLQGLTQSGSNNTHIYVDGLNSQTPLYFIVKKLPAATEIAYRPDLLPASWSGYSAGVSGGCSTTSGSFGDPSACTGIAVTQLTQRNITCSQNSTLPSISCTVPKPGMYFVNAVVTLRSSVASGSNIFARIVDGSGVEVTHGNAAQMVQNNGQMPFPLSGLYSSTGLSPSWKVQFYNDSGATTSIVNVGANTAAINWSIIAADQSLTAPVLVGSVTSSSTGQEHIERAVIDSAKCTTSTCTLNSSTPGISSITRASTGQYVINFLAGTYSGQPSCSITGNTLGTTVGVCSGNGAATTSLKNVECVNNAFALQDDGFNVICQGPR